MANDIHPTMYVLFACVCLLQCLLNASPHMTTPKSPGPHSRTNLMYTFSATPTISTYICSRSSSRTCLRVIHINLIDVCSTGRCVGRRPCIVFPRLCILYMDVRMCLVHYQTRVYSYMEFSYRVYI